MSTPDASFLLQALQRRYAVKVFDPARSIPETIWASLEQAIVLTPSSYGLQPWKFLVITSATLKEELRPFSWNQSQITDCSHLVVFLRKREVSEADIQQLLQCTASTRGVTQESLTSYGDLIRKDLIEGPRSKAINAWSANQVYIALGNLLTSTAFIGIDSCPIEGFSPADYDRILQLEHTPYQSTVVCACGYRSEADRYGSLPKVRYPISELIEHR